jgi:hypothetical protein
MTARYLPRKRFLKLALSGKSAFLTPISSPRDFWHVGGLASGVGAAVRSDRATARGNLARRSWFDRLAIVRVRERVRLGLTPEGGLRRCESHELGS